MRDRIFSTERLVVLLECQQFIARGDDVGRAYSHIFERPCEQRFDDRFWDPRCTVLLRPQSISGDLCGLATIPWLKGELRHAQVFAEDIQVEHNAKSLHETKRT